MPPPPRFTQPPFGLPLDDEALLTRLFEDEAWGEATVLLRALVDGHPAPPWRWLALLAWARFHDALEVMTDELAVASREALRWLDRAFEAEADLSQLASFRDEVERALDAVTRHEEALLAKVGPDDDVSALDDAELEALAHLVDRQSPGRAEGLFRALHARVSSSLREAFAARAALAKARSSFEAARPELESLLHAPWTSHPLHTERLTLEAVETELLLHLEGARFEEAWAEAEARGEALDFPFPAAWPHQERLLERAVELHSPHAAALAERVVGERATLSKPLAALVSRARQLKPASPGPRH